MSRVQRKLGGFDLIAYLIRRLGQAVLVIILASFMVFMAMHLLPGDPILIYLGEAEMESSSEEQLMELRKEYGLDKPLLLQYLVWISDLAKGDMGKSIASGERVSQLIKESLPITIHIGALAFLLSAFLGIAAGVVCAVRRGGYLDTLLTLMANLGITIPVFWLGIMLIYFFGLKLGWLPIQGYTSPVEDFWLSFKKILMPVFCLAIFTLASTTRQTRSSMLEVIRQDYIRTAWSKGLRERVIIIRHVLKNGLIPVITLKGIHVRLIFGGSVLIETVFNIPGMGRLAVEAIFNQDFPIVQGVVIVIGLVVTLANLLVDISYGWLDPRIRYS